MRFLFLPQSGIFSARKQRPKLLKKLILGMKLTAFILLVALIQVSAEGMAQTVTISSNNISLEKVFRNIQKQTGYHFLCTKEQLSSSKKVDIHLTDAPLKKVLDHAFKDQPLTYSIFKNTIIVKHKPSVPSVILQETPLPPPIHITGTVTDSATGNPLVGVTIQVKGNTMGTTTDANGEFSLNVPDDAILVVSYLGYTTKEIPVEGNTEINIALATAATGLNQVVVVGYGTQKKKDLSNAISTIQSDEITTTTSASLAQSLEGKVPGLQIRQQNSMPGSFSSTIQIRGFGEPVYVIDGIVRGNGVDFQQLNPYDIESITILKDASAAIYGMNAANGVILITTKKGGKGKPSFTYNGTVGWQLPTNVPKMSSAAQYFDMYNDAIFFRDGSPFLPKEELEKWHEGGPGYESTNWYDETFKKAALQQQNDFSVRGGSDKVNYYVSFGNFRQEGLFKSGDLKYNRYNFRSNLTAELSDNLSASVMLSGRYSRRYIPGGDGFIWIYKGTIISHPDEQPYINGNPEYPANIINRQNPVVMAQKKYAGYRDEKNKDIHTSAALTYDVPFIEGLTAKGRFAYDSYNMFTKVVWKNYKVYNQDLSYEIINPPRIANAIDDVDRLVFQGQLAYQNTFRNKHNIDATLVYETRYYNKRYSYLKREYDFYTIDVVDYASGLQTNNGHEDERATISYVGRVNYNYLNKYLVGASFRYDGSYRYAPGKRWALFPNYSLGWRLSEEKFLKDNLSFLDDLKIRASYGIIGESVGEPFQYVLGFSPVTNQGAEFINGRYTGGLAAPGIINEDFTWVRSEIFDIGLDISLFKEKLAFTFDYYQRHKSGLLKQRTGNIPNTFGGDMPIENIGSRQTRGFDFILTHKNKIADFTYSASFNFNVARTMYRTLDRPDSRSSFDNWKSNYTNRWNDFVWGYTVLGQFQNEEEIAHAPVHGGDQGNTQILPGDYKYKDVNGDGIINGNDLLPNLRKRHPKLFYGMVLNANWKNFDATMVWQGSALNTIRFNEVFSLLFFNNGNVPAYFHDRWHLEDVYDPNSEWVPGRWPASRFSQNMQSSYRESEIWRRDAKYLRLKSLSIGYTFPLDRMHINFIDKLRLYVNAHNLLTITDPFLKQFDPERYEGDYFAGYNYPLIGSFNFGLNLIF